MKRTTTSAAAALLATATAASAGGIERTTQSIGFMYEPGSYGEFSISRVSPDVSGVAASGLGPFPAGPDSGDMSGDYTSLSFAFKTDVNDRLSIGFIFEQPFGADVYYPMGTGYAYGGSNADLNVDELKLIAKYKLDGGFSIHGGLRMQQVKGNVALFNGYSLQAPTSSELGYFIGAAYEKPEIAMRIALTYHSAITHEFAAIENNSPSLPFETTFPQSLNLEAQTGIAEGTLLLASVRWVDWSEFDITPFGYNLATGSSLVDYEDDVITYTVGVARRFTDNFAGIATVSYEAQNGGFSGNLGPTDGRTSIGLAGRYTVGKAVITGGVNYSWVGDARTENPTAPGTTFGDFSGNTAVGVGLRVGYTF